MDIQINVVKILKRKISIKFVIATFIGTLILICIASYIFLGKDYFFAPKQVDFINDTKSFDTNVPNLLEIEGKRTDFGSDTPTDFPTDVPIESGMSLIESYSLEYPDRLQLSITFDSAKSVKENYDIYKDFLYENAWELSNAYENNQSSLLYSTNGEDYMVINITESIFFTSSSSQVSINVFYANHNAAPSSESIYDSIITKEESHYLDESELKVFLETNTPEAQALQILLKSKPSQQ
ncbi:MAG: hypothetical protein K9M10_01890 [Candidatus Pacebacteria bacterium]|nr:hypothetical protein [Candidatus Paceibacterota bacterium]